MSGCLNFWEHSAPQRPRRFFLAAPWPTRLVAGPSSHRGRQIGRALISTSPVLEELGRNGPDVLVEFLGRSRKPVDPVASQALSTRESPVLAELFRESPEASINLIHLIEEAALGPVGTRRPLAACDSPRQRADTDGLSNVDIVPGMVWPGHSHAGVSFEMIAFGV